MGKKEEKELDNLGILILDMIRSIELYSVLYDYE